jgi:predicted ATPase/DNA-binding SARP family transcriptional activator
VSEQPRVALLGPVLVEDPAGTLTPLTGALARTLVVTLALAGGQTITAETLIDELWGDEPPRGARAALQTLVSRLRRSVADGIVASEGNGYRLAVDRSDVDLTRAADAAASASASLRDTPASAAEHASTALALWRGEPGADLEARVGDALAGRADEVARSLRRVLAEALAACDDPEAAVRLWEQETAAHPFDESAVAGRMRALAASDRLAEALGVFAEHRERLADELGADPSAELVRLNADLLRRSSAEATAVRRIGIRRAPTALIGREHDTAVVAATIREHRLVTILGAGGLGKTRLAHEVAAGAPDGQAVVFVELASIGDGADIVPTIGALLGLAELRAGRTLRTQVVEGLRTRIVRALAEAPTLLVLDNCEHIVADVAGVVLDLLAEIPDLRVLTTSRAPLAVPGEVVTPLAPLPVESDGAAVRLFTERARAARPGAVLPLDAVRRICTRLDGSPLAIELAAARVRGMSVDEIERRLDDRFALLRGGDRTAPERHRTLLAVIEWSWRLLDVGAQDLLTRLALFPDGLSVDAVEAVAAEDRSWSALDDLAELVEQSLVQLTEREGEPVRYRLLETVREFGAARLDERGATDDVRAAMIRWGVAFARERNVFVVGVDVQRRVFREVERESDNLVALLRWSLRADAPSAVATIFAALGTYWSVRGAHGEVIAISADVVALLRRQPPTDDALLATTMSLIIAGASAAFLDRRVGALAVSALRRIRRMIGPTGNAATDSQAHLLTTLGRPEESFALLERYREDPDDTVACFALTLSAPLAENRGDVEDALRYARRAETLSSRSGDGWTAGTAAVSRAQLLNQSGFPIEALAAAEAARERLQWFGADDDVYEVGWTIGLAAAASGDAERARRIADELDVPRSNVNRFDEGDGGAQYRVLAHGIRAEADRVDGRLDDALAEYERCYTWIREHRRQSPQWFVLAAASRIATAVERDRRDGRESSLQTDATARDAARAIRVTDLVTIRMEAWWLDLPVVGTGLAGLAVWGAVTGEIDAATIATLWGIARRVGARQDFAVMTHASIRPILVEVVGERALADAETASAGVDRAEAVAAARAVLEEIRIPRRGPV